MQAGVGAIFTAENSWRGKLPAVFGVLAVASGGAVWSWLFLEGSSSLSLVSLSVLLVTIGVGLSAYSLALRKSKQENERLRSALYELEVLVEPKNGPGDAYPNGEQSTDSIARVGEKGRMSKTLALAIVEAVVIILIYGGLVREYESNVNMQKWVQANIWPGAYILNYNALFLVVGGLLGMLIFQVLLGRQNSQ